ncbi:MAG: PilZ domain-containing protein [Pseudomonadota bacterium]
MAGDSDMIGVAADLTPEERRRAPRRKVCVGAQLSFGDARARAECRVVDLSATGARVEILCDDKHPKRRLFRSAQCAALIFDREASMIECDIVWASKTHAGLSFRTAFMHATNEKRW